MIETPTGPGDEMNNASQPPEGNLTPEPWPHELTLADLGVRVEKGDVAPDGADSLIGFPAVGRYFDARIPAVRRRRTLP